MLQLSHLKLLAGVVFALFVLTACGGGGGAAAPAAADSGTDSGSSGGGNTGGGSDTRTCTDAQFDNGTECVAKITAEKCNGDGYNGVNAAGNECVDYTKATCETAGANKYFAAADSCVAAIAPSSCDSMQATDNNLCLPVLTLDTNTNTYTDNCGVDLYYNSSTNTCDTKVVAANCNSGQTVNEGLNVCVTDISGAVATCDSSEFHRTSDNTCEPLVVVADCASGAVVVADNKCSTVTASMCDSMQANPADNTACLPASVETCTTTNGFYYNAANAACDITVAASSCGTDETHNYGMNYCGATTNLTAADFQGNSNSEYYKSNALDAVKAAEAYANISLLAADMPTIRQGGAGQTVSVVKSFLVGDTFKISHQEFDNGDGTTAFASIYNASTDTLSENNLPDCIALCSGSPYAALIAGRKGGTGTEQMHGIAYNAQLKGISTSGTSSSDFVTHLLNAIPAGVGSDIIAMNHVWTDEYLSACTTNTAAGVKYIRTKGITTGAFDGGGTDCDGAAALSNDTLATDELTAWQAAVTGDNKTIMVFSSSNDEYNNNGQGFNSENGQPIYEDTTTAISLIGGTDPMAANIPNYRAAYPVLYDEFDDMGDSDASNDIADFTGSGRWLVVTGLNAAGDKILPTANGCGVAMGFCLAAPGDIYTASIDGSSNNGHGSVTGTSYASSTVAGGLAVLKGAFPAATPEQLTRLVLQTSTYIPLATHDDATYRRLVCKSDADSSIVEVVTTCSTGFTHADHPTDKEADGTTAKKLYVNPVYGYGKLNLHAATVPAIKMSMLSVGNNESIGVLWQDTQLTLSSHFGTGLDSISLGIGDEYGRHFITTASKITSAPVAPASFDEYMGNMLADNVQSQKLGGQTKLNYSNTAQPWMNLEYTSGKATSKIAFQDNYKISPLNDNATTSILRANHIRPASNNIGMMDVDYQLSGALSLSSYAARGEYDTGYKFDELGTDFDVNYKKSHLNIAIGNIREHDQFLGTHTTGGYALNAPTVSRFTDVTYGHDLGKTDRFNIYANYINYETDVDMLHDQFASIDNLQADQYQVGFTGKSLISDDDNLNVALITKLGVTDGALNQNTTLGYTADGAFNDVSQSYDLAVSERHQQFEITYQGKIYQNSQDEVSVLKDNRFFTTIRVDQNLNHVQGASQTEVISGINARF